MLLKIGICCIRTFGKSGCETPFSVSEPPEALRGISVTFPATLHLLFFCPENEIIKLAH